MADLLSPILITLQGDESDAFWCFVYYMNKSSLKDNFRHDGSGMRRNLQTLERLIKVTDIGLYSHLRTVEATNLFCCFRWFLVNFKRYNLSLFFWLLVLRRVYFVANLTLNQRAASGKSI
jgi:hypothetical protein